MIDREKKKKTCFLFFCWLYHFHLRVFLFHRFRNKTCFFPVILNMVSDQTFAILISVNSNVNRIVLRSVYLLFKLYAFSHDLHTNGV